MTTAPKDGKLMRPVPPIDLEIWRLAASRLPRLTVIVFLLWSRGRTYDRIGKALGISRRRVRRHMLKSIAAIGRAASEVRDQPR
jgi:predicted ArsR family transcriptional regulator